MKGRGAVPCAPRRRLHSGRHPAISPGRRGSRSASQGPRCANWRECLRAGYPEPPGFRSAFRKRASISAAVSRVTWQSLASVHRCAIGHRANAGKNAPLAIKSMGSSGSQVLPASHPGQSGYIMPSMSAISFLADFNGRSATIASVVTSRPATEAAY